MHWLESSFKEYHSPFRSTPYLSPRILSLGGKVVIVQNDNVRMGQILHQWQLTVAIPLVLNHTLHRHQSVVLVENARLEDGAKGAAVKHLLATNAQVNHVRVVLRRNVVRLDVHRRGQVLLDDVGEV